MCPKRTLRFLGHSWVETMSWLDSPAKRKICRYCHKPKEDR